MYVVPKKLRRGSKVALVAPSSPPKPEQLLEGMDVMKEMGLVPVLGPCVREVKTSGIHSGTVAERVAELDWAFKDPTISGVFAVRGGVGAAAVLPHLDYGMIRRSRKPFLGMSDNTALNVGIFSKSGLINFNGQSVSIHLEKGVSFRDADVESFRLSIRLLMSDELWGLKPFDFNPYLPRNVCPGKASGIVMGGNADTFVHMLGTPFMPDLEGTVLFLEDVHKSPAELSREFLHLQLAGCLKRVNGVVLGEFAEVPKGQRQEHSTGVEDIVKEYFQNGPPCTYGYPFSHGPLTGPLPIGAHCYVDADVGHVEFDFAMSN